jgi:hypothetical protein
MWIHLAPTQRITRFRAALWIEIDGRHSVRTDVTQKGPEGAFVRGSQHFAARLLSDRQITARDSHSELRDRLMPDQQPK